MLKTNISTGDYTEYEWDHRNRLTRIAQYNSSDTLQHEVEYTYDVFNRRITKEIDADGAGGGGTDTIQYVYDDDDIILAFDGSDALTNRYLHGPMIDQILADEDDTGDVLWPLTDNLGSVRDNVDSTGSVVNHLTYDAYGNITSETATSVNHIYAYTGRERDEESDLQFNRARYYDLAIGQWISEDPIAFASQDSNLRRYVRNSSTNATDPTGLIDLGLLPKILKDLSADNYNTREQAENQLRQMITSIEDINQLDAYLAGNNPTGKAIELDEEQQARIENAVVPALIDLSVPVEMEIILGDDVTFAPRPATFRLALEWLRKGLGTAGKSRKSECLQEAERRLVSQAFSDDTFTDFFVTAVAGGKDKDKIKVKIYYHKDGYVTISVNGKSQTYKDGKPFVYTP